MDPISNKICTTHNEKNKDAFEFCSKLYSSEMRVLGAHSCLKFVPEEKVFEPQLSQTN